MIFVGVDTGASALKAVALKKEQHKIVVVDRHCFSFDLSFSPKELEKQKFDSLKNLADLYKGREVRWIACLPQNQISTHLLYFPFGQRHKIMKSLMFELEDKLLFPIEDMISDICILSRTEQGQWPVLVFSAFKKHVVQKRDELKAAGIQPVILTCGASSLANLIENRESQILRKQPEDPSEHQTHLYLKIGHSHSTIFIKEKGRVKNLYNFEWGVASCVKKLATRYETSFQKSMKHLQEQSFVLTEEKGYTGSQIAFSKAITESFEDLIQRIKLLLLDMKSDRQNRLKKIFIFGGGSQIRNLQNFLTQKLGVPVRRLKGSEVFSDWSLMKAEGASPHNMARALGIAMEGLRKFNNPAINFLKGPFAVRFNLVYMAIRRLKDPVWMGMGLCVMLLMVYAFVRQGQTQRLLNKVDVVFKKRASQIMGLPVRRITVRKVHGFMESKKKVLKNKELVHSLSQWPSALDRLKNISLTIKKTPGWDLEIEKLKIRNTSIHIEGKVATPYLQDLKNSLKEMAQKNTLKALVKAEDTPLIDHTHFAYSFTQKVD